MHRLFGLSRDPFLPGCDDALYWESPERARARRRASDALARGRGVWFAGPRGAGRSALLERVAEDAALAGAAAAVIRGGAPASGADLLALLFDALGYPSEASDPVARSAALYRTLLDAFCRAGPPVLALDVPELGSEARREVELLAGLKVAGRPLVALVLAGGGPGLGFEEVPLEAPTPADLEAFLTHRAAACGRPDFFHPAELGAIAARASGFGEALSLARRALGHRAFQGEASAGTPLSAAASILPEDDLGEVERLLESLSPPR